jgi:hypothetical protein
MKSVVHVALILATLLGVATTVQQWATLSELRSEYNRLGARFGFLDIDDPSKFYVLRLQSDDPQEFTWRMYRPPVKGIQYRVISGTGSSQSGTDGSQTDSDESIHRYRFLFEDNQMELHRISESGSGYMSFGNQDLAAFLKTHWDQLQIETIDDGPHPTDQPLQFLRISIPDAILAELTEGQPRYKRLQDHPFLQVIAGTETAFEKLDAEKDKR